MLLKIVILFIKKIIFFEILNWIQLPICFIYEYTFNYKTINL